MSFSQKILDIVSSLKGDRFFLHSGKGGGFSLLGLGKKHELELFGNDPQVLSKLYGFWEKHGQNKMMDYPDSPMEGGMFLFLSYDLIENFENIELKNTHLHIPKIYAVVPEALIVFDHAKETIISSDEAINFSTNTFIPSQNKTFWKNQITKNDYIHAIEEVHKELKKGNTFQVNFAQKFSAKQTMPSFDIFYNLAQLNPTAFSAFFETPFGEIISGTPERLLELKNGVLETRPIKGTRKRGEGKSDDELTKELLADAKDHAEHVMIVDLERNDMGKVCEYGTVEVTKYAEVEKYSHVQHLVSTIQGKLRKDTNFCDVIHAMFPGGSITGCPKVETCKIIHRLEQEDRGVYTGSLGFVNHKGDMDLNILIRTIYAHDGELVTHAGGGIVLDSLAEKEYQESLDKAQAQFAATNGKIAF